MPEEIDFTDLAAITNITSDTVVEKFSSIINASFFDASNMLGTLKQKMLIDFSIQFPGQNKVELTEQGKQLIAEAESKASAPIDNLDNEILNKLYNGTRTVGELGASLNLRPKDLALHLYKLHKQQYINYDFKNGSVNMLLTEKGFMQVRGAGAQAQQPQPVGMPATPQQQADQMQQSQDQQAPKTVEEIEAAIKHAKQVRLITIIAAVVVVVFLVILTVLQYHLIPGI